MILATSSVLQKDVKEDKKGKEKGTELKPGRKKAAGMLAPLMMGTLGKILNVKINR